MKNNVPKEVVDIVKSIFTSVLDISKYKIFFFGSRVNGEASERADVDVAVDGDSPLDALTFSKIKEDLENSKTLYTIDFVDLQNTSISFRNHVLNSPILPVF